MFENGKVSARAILDWVYKELGNPKWEKYGVAVVNEQTAYRVPGNSHTSRQGAVELLYASKTGDLVAKEKGIRQLSWATYMVKEDGESTYPNGETWMTDGYGDYIRHYIRAMESFPEIAPSNQDHLLSTTSVIRNVEYKAKSIQYRTFDLKSTEILRLQFKPKSVQCGELKLTETDLPDQNERWNWKPLIEGGILKIVHQNGNKIVVNF